ncbi:MAG: hypothetical protein NUV93_02460 [Firmicutes bacterium]|jgi:hypothetical protein|nr:hypothetical protein [Bacillota bacterium]
MYGLLLPKSPKAWLAFLYFGIAWWLLFNKPVLGPLVERSMPPNITWVLGMPVDFAYVIFLTAVTCVAAVYILSTWEVKEE